MEGFIAAEDVISVVRSFVALLQGARDLRNASMQLAGAIEQGVRRE
jgi:hypothetical protein